MRGSFSRALALLAAIGALLVAFPKGATSAESPAGAWQIRGSAGFATQDLGDWKDALDTERRVRGESVFGTPRFGRGFPLHVELAFRRRRFAFGAGFLGQRAPETWIQNRDSASVWHETRLTMRVALASVTCSARPQGFYGRVEAGIGWARATQSMEAVGFGFVDPAGDESGDWKGTAPVFGIALGYQRAEASPGAIVFFQGGYRRLNAGELDGEWHGASGSRAGPPRDAEGRVIGTDFSGFHLVFGCGYQFGPRVSP